MNRDIVADRAINRDDHRWNARASMCASKSNNVYTCPRLAASF